MTLFINGQNQINWSVNDSAGQVINANVTASLYWGRDRIRPDLSPGIVAVNAFSLTLNSTTNVYSAVVNSFTGVYPGGGYTLIVNATNPTNGSAQIDHWERPAVLILNGP